MQKAFQCRTGHPILQALHENSTWETRFVMVWLPNLGCDDFLWAAFESMETVIPARHNYWSRLTPTYGLHAGRMKVCA